MLFILQSCHKERRGELKEETAICASNHSKEGTTVLQEHPIINLSCEFATFNNILSLFISAPCLIFFFSIFVILAVGSIHLWRYENLAEYPWESYENDKPKECREIAKVCVKYSSYARAGHKTHSRKRFSKADEFFAVLRVLQGNQGIASCLHKGVTDAFNKAEWNIGIEIPPVIVDEFSCAYTKLC